MGTNASTSEIGRRNYFGVQNSSDQRLKTPALRPPIHLRRESFRIFLNSDSGDLSLKFVYDSYDDISLTFYYFASESTKSFGGVDFSYLDSEKNPPSQVFEKPKGINLEFFESLSCLNLSKHSIAELNFTGKKVYPLIIETRPKNEESTVETTYCKFRLEEGVYTISVIRQKLSMNGKAYELLEIFGAGVHEECAVCLTNIRNTVVLPCRHLCLCLLCAEIVKQQNISKCPICRIFVASFIHIKGRQLTS